MEKNNVGLEQEWSQYREVGKGNFSGQKIGVFENYSYLMDRKKAYIK